MSYAIPWKQLASSPRVYLYGSRQSQRRRGRVASSEIAAHLQEPNMNTMPTNTLIIALLAIAIVVGVIAWMLVQRQRSLRLKNRFGAEYDRAVAEYHSRPKAEAELLKREERVAGLKIVPLTAADSARFSQAWGALRVASSTIRRVW